MRSINILSFIATAAATYFCMMIYQRFTTSIKDKLNTCTIWVMASLAWWNLCDAFFYVAPTKELAWFWHRLGAPGWCGFIAVTAWFFLVMMGIDQKLKPALVALFAAFPAALTLRFLLAAPTALAEDLVQSTSGLGWTYVQRYQTVWPFLFLAYLLLYLGGALLLLHRWQKREAVSSSRRRLAKGFIALDSFVVAFGFVSIFVLPYFTPRFPPAGCIATMIFGLWYWGWLRDFDLLHVALALNPGRLLESCVDAMVVTDEECRMLYANTQAKLLLGTSQWEAACYLDYLTPDCRPRLEAALQSDAGKSIPLELALQNGTPVMCSASRMTSRRGMNLWVLCMQDVTQLKETQRKLHQMALYDELTGLHNRRSLNDILTQWICAARESGADFTLLFLDLTEFKRINDTFGHKAGDEALLTVALTLQTVVDQEDVLARFAGDEFVILHWERGGADIVPRLHQALARVDCAAFAPGTAMAVDVGACRFSEVEAGDADEMLQRADNRMYRSKLARKTERPYQS